MIIKRVASLERGLQGRPMLTLRVLHQENSHALDASKVALVVAKRDRQPNDPEGIVHLDVRGDVVERGEVELVV